MGFRRYSSANGATTAMSGKILTKIIGEALFFRKFRFFFKPHTTVTMYSGFKKECAFTHQYGVLYARRK
jgi:hypothetical protein